MKLLSPQLHAFITVKEHLTIASAAKQLKLTQAAVTLRIQGLEESLGTTLFIRSRRGMQLTQAGETLARYCQRSLELEAEILPEFETGSNEQSPVSFVLQGPSSIIHNRVVPTITEYAKQFPFVSIQLLIDDLDSGVERLKKGSIDLVICERSQVTKEFDSRIIKSERYILVGPKSWRKRSIENILKTERIVDFNPTDVMTISFLKKYKFDQIAKSDRHFVNVTDAIAQLVVSGLGYSVLSQETADPYIGRGEMIDLTPGKFLDYQVAMAWYPRKQMPKAFHEFIQLIK